MGWSELSDLAPCTKAVWEAAAEAHPDPVLDGVPRFLGLGALTPLDPEWGAHLGTKAEHSESTVREVLLRYLITRAVVDQGSDIEGVERWHAETLRRCYESEIRILHDPESFVRAYNVVVEIADSVRVEVVALRSGLWAGLSDGRHEASYNPFNVDGMRGGTQAHWFVSARLYPALLLSRAVDGGLTEIVFGRVGEETPIQMARRLRNDRRLGLGWTMGDKACDLFAKWSIGTYRLGEGLDPTWEAADAPLPMDQRIGRLLTRCGLLDEFFGAPRMMSTSRFGFTPQDGQARPGRDDADIPPGRWFLRVMEFRRHGLVARGATRDWLNREWVRLARPGPTPDWHPQDVVALLCRSLNDERGTILTPVILDDFFMGLGGTPCVDHHPDCPACELAEACQANTVQGRVGLKLCYT